MTTNSTDIPTRFLHTSYTQKNGFTWRKRYSGTTISISLLTHDYELGMGRASSLTIKFLECQPVGMACTAMHKHLKNYRDHLIREERIKACRNEYPASTTKEVVLTSRIVKQPSVPTTEKHSFEDAKQAFIDHNSEWKKGTRESFFYASKLFMEWVDSQSINHVEDLTGDDVVRFKQYLDGKDYKPAGKKQRISTLQGWFKYLVDVKEWISKSPFLGMGYRDGEISNLKEEITPAQYETAMKATTNASLKWAMAMMFHCGFRMMEVCQIRPSDYRVIDGVKCISINDEDDKELKNKASRRNIPVNDALIEMGLWKQKPDMRKLNYDNGRSRIEGLFNKQGLKRTSHCFRHGVSVRMADAEVPEMIVDFIMGHAPKNERSKSYMNRRPYAVMLKSLNSI